MRIAALALVALAAQLGITIGGGEGGSPISASLLYGVGTLAALGAAWLSVRGERFPIRAAVAAALLARVLAFPQPYANDVDRYLFEGRLVLEGENPYVKAPIERTEVSDPYRTRVNHPRWTAIYPPLFQLFGAAVCAVWYHPSAFKIAFTLLDLGILALLILMAGERRIAATLAYGLSPLLATQVAGAAHNEGLWIAFAVLAAALVGRGRPGWAAVAVGAAVASKFTALFMLPFFVCTIRPRYWALMAVVPLVTVLPFAGAGLGLFDALIGFAKWFRFGSILAPGLHALLPKSWASILGSVIGAAVVLAVWWHWRRSASGDLVAGLRDATGAALLVMPTLHIWYVCALMPWCALRLRTPWWWFIGAHGAYFLYYVEMARVGGWTDTPWLRLPIFAPVLIAWAVVGIRGILKRRCRAEN